MPWLSYVLLLGSKSWEVALKSSRLTAMGRHRGLPRRGQVPSHSLGASLMLAWPFPRGHVRRQTLVGHRPREVEPPLKAFDFGAFNLHPSPDIGIAPSLLGYMVDTFLSPLA